MSTATQVYVSPLATNQVALQTNTNQRLTSQITQLRESCSELTSLLANERARSMVLSSRLREKEDELIFTNRENPLSVVHGDLRCDVECTSHTLEGNLEKE